MYSFESCAELECGKPRLSGSDRCAAHAADPTSLARETAARLEAAQDHRDLNLAGLRLSDLDLSGKRFFGLSFIGCGLSRVLFSGCVFRLCFFDRALIDSCDFSRIDAQFCSFGGARFRESAFEGSELLHANFSGAELVDCTLSGSNLYDSRFIRTTLVRTAVEDCDLKRVYLIPAKEEGVSYRFSNTNEAIRDLEHLYQ